MFADKLLTIHELKALIAKELSYPTVEKMKLFLPLIGKYLCKADMTLLDYGVRDLQTICVSENVSPSEDVFPGML